jgi:hypothetical protein
MQKSHSKQDATHASPVTQIVQLKVIDDSASRLEVANILLAQKSRLDICGQLFIQLLIDDPENLKTLESLSQAEFSNHKYAESMECLFDQL